MQSGQINLYVKPAYLSKCRSCGPRNADLLILDLSNLISDKAYFTAMHGISYTLKDDFIGYQNNIYVFAKLSLGYLHFGKMKSITKNLFGYNYSKLCQMEAPTAIKNIQ